ncbi:hypothetical protein [Streptomyces coffeae]|uniref:Uncharacterized protein n=1 Tax=Streptomyces coffeae TaxID=621382 RepID=A0ABS1NAW9_9ACTN|nr:hypothetical protein [Streptomyces coffeae]MBL1097203.1 hypothetical protein [Streptomyces coffeae]
MLKPLKTAFKAAGVTVAAASIAGLFGGAAYACGDDHRNQHHNRQHDNRHGHDHHGHHHHGHHHHGN